MSIKTIYFLLGITLSVSFFGCQTSMNRDVAQVKNTQVGLMTNPKLSDYTPYKYEVLFTDPECGIYTYTTPVKSIGGKLLKQKPQNVYCKNKYDLNRSGSRPQSPQYRLVEWIKDPSVKEIFFTYLSFRNKAVKNALCEAAQQRQVKIQFVMSSSEDRSAADELVACAPNLVQMKGRGLEGDLGYAHNKFFIINPHSDNEFKIVFSSGNMTSGPVIHHENWNFITTHAKSYFAQSHLCVMNAEWDETTGRSRAAYISSVRDCRSKIAAKPETDIKAFFVPGEGEPEVGVNDGMKTAADYMIYGDGVNPGISNATRIWMGCHRFFYGKMVSALGKRMTSFKTKPDMRIVADDDTYYKANDPSYTIGDTMPEEWTRMQNLMTRGARVRFMETNGDEHQLHHSKYLIFGSSSDSESTAKNKSDELAINDFKAVFTGSANLTGAGFNKNWENSYYITIPEVVNAFAVHYVKTWKTLASEINDLPAQGLVADKLSDTPVNSDGTPVK